MKRSTYGLFINAPEVGAELVLEPISLWTEKGGSVKARGRVLSVNYRHHFFCVQFYGFRECFKYVPEYKLPTHRPYIRHN